jgi:superfamily II DNA helicase RecQ
MDDFFIESAPTGIELRETLRRESHGLRKMAQAETAMMPESTPSPPSLDIGSLETTILECVATMNFRFGQSTIAAVLRGSLNQTIKRWRLERTPHHGKLSYLKQAEIQQSIEWLVAQECLTIRKSKHVYPLIGLTEKGWEVIKKSA